MLGNVGFMTKNKLGTNIFFNTIWLHYILQMRILCLGNHKKSRILFGYNNLEYNSE